MSDGGTFFLGGEVSLFFSCAKSTTSSCFYTFSPTNDVFVDVLSPFLPSATFALFLSLSPHSLLPHKKRGAKNEF